MWEAFAMQKLLTFFMQKIAVLGIFFYIYYVWNVNWLKNMEVHPFILKAYTKTKLNVLVKLACVQA